MYAELSGLCENEAPTFNSWFLMVYHFKFTIQDIPLMQLIFDAT